MLGIDIISTVHTLGTMMELYERGILTKKDTDGIPLKWGDRDAIITMVHKIVRREGFGDILAEGALRAARKIGRGAENYVMHTKGLSHLIYDLRAFKGCALATAVGPRDLVKSGPPMEYLYREAEYHKPQNKEWYLKFASSITGTKKAAIPTAYDGKPAAVIFQEHEQMVTDMMGTCKWLTTWLGMPLTSTDLTELFCACTGVDMDVKAVLRVAERVRNLERAFNVREGLTRKLETLPKRYFEKPLPDGVYKGEVLDRKKFESMKDEYYRLKGWDVKTGIPTRQKLKELGLKSVINDLKKLNKIPAETVG